jgi:hypothetical protein
MPPKLAGYPAYYKGISVTEPVTGWTITVEKDGRHVSAHDTAGALQWRIDPLNESGVGYYRTPWPTIDYMAVARNYAWDPNANIAQDRWPYDQPAVEIVYNSSQFIRVNLATAQVVFLGQD